jgi:hypothetical protein
MRPLNVKTYLNKLGEEHSHQDLFSKINEVNEIQQLFLSVAPPHLAQRCRLSLPIDGKLVIFAENGSIATRLKQILPSLLLKLQRQGWEITSIKISMQGYQATHTLDTKVHKKRQLGPRGKESLNQFAASLPTSELKQAIESLLKDR